MHVTSRVLVKVKNVKNAKFLAILISLTILTSALPLANAGYLSTVAADEPKYFFEIKLHTTTESSFTELFKEQLKQIGIKLTIEIVDGASMWSRGDEGGISGKTFDQGGYDLMYHGLGSLSTVTSGLDSFATWQKSPNGQNWFNWYNGEFDSELKKGVESQNSGNLTAANEHYYVAQKILMDELPWIPLFFNGGHNLARKDLIFTDSFASGAGTGVPVATEKYGPVSVEPGDWFYWAIRFLAREGKSYADDTVFTSAVTADLQMFNPILAGVSSSNTEIHDTMYDGLLWPSPTFYFFQDYRGDLATTWEVAPDGLTYTFHLRTDVKWHDGVPFTSKDVVMTYQALLDPETGARAGGGVQQYLSDVTATDDNTVVFKFSQKDPGILELFSTPILPDHIWGSIPHKDWLTSEYNTGLKTPIGTGPYKFVEWVKGDHITMDKYSDYHLCPIFFDHYIYKVIPDPEAERIAIQKGEADIRTRGTWEDQQLAEQNPTILKFTVGRLFECRGISVNTANPILANMYVRKAISLAMPREHIVTDINKGIGVPANQYTMPGIIGNDPSIPAIPYDLAMAKQMLVKAGYNYDWLKTTPIITPPTPTTNDWMTPAIGGGVAGLLIGALAVYFLRRKP
jgi:ABC-type transport system substrate-binding protein